MEKKSNNLLTGIVTILPIILFIVIIVWLCDLILGWVGHITSLFPQSMWDALQLPPIIVNALGFIILCIIVWCIGWIMNQQIIGEKLKNWFNPIISKIPLLNPLSKITNQVTMTLKNTNSFKEVVLVRFPTERSWSIGFITGEDPEIFKGIEENIVSIFIPTTPNPTNGFLIYQNSNDLKRTKTEVAEAIQTIISMGMAGATKKIIKETEESSPSSE